MHLLCTPRALSSLVRTTLYMRQDCRCAWDSDKASSTACGLALGIHTHGTSESAGCQQSTALESPVLPDPRGARLQPSSQRKDACAEAVTTRPQRCGIHNRVFEVHASLSVRLVVSHSV